MHKKLQGSLTIEASIIMPIVIFIIITMIYFIFYLHDQAYLKTVANNMSLKASKTILYKGRSIEDGNIDYETAISKHKVSDIYWRFINSHNDTNTIVNYGKKTIFSTQNNNVFGIKEKDIEISASVTGNILKKKVKINIKAPFHIPFLFFNLYLNWGKPIIIKVSSKAVIIEPTELIRNMDMITNTAENIKILEKPIKKYYEIIEKIKKTLRK